MNLAHLRYIVEVERYGSITKAAAALYMGQPNLSKAIKELEIEIGIPIFRRSAKGVVPTERGQEFLQYAKAIIVQMEKMEELYKSPDDSRIDFQIMIPRASYITHAFTKFLNKLPDADNINAKIKETNSLEAINAVVECECSMAIIRCALSQEEFFLSLLAEKKLKHTDIRTFEYMVVTSKKGPLAAKKSVSEKDLEQCIEILHGDNAVPSFSETLLKKSGSPKVPKKHIYVYERGSQFDILSAAPNTFMYVSPIPQEILDRYGLVQLPCSGTKKVNKDILIYQANYRITKTYQQFLDELDKIIEESV